MVITGLRAGGSRPIRIGGVIQPWRQASNHNASDNNGLRVGRGGTDFCNHPVSIGDQDGLATGGEPDILTELIFEQFETDGAHAGNVVLEATLSMESAPMRRPAILSRARGRLHVKRGTGKQTLKRTDGFSIKALDKFQTFSL
jgi:hypothetical protein